MSEWVWVTVEKPVVTKAPDTGRETTQWVPISQETGGGAPRVERFRAQVQDALPSRSEAVKQGLETARNQTRLRLRWRSDITSDMRVIIHRAEDVIYQIVGGPAEIGGRKHKIELVLERYGK